MKKSIYNKFSFLLFLVFAFLIVSFKETFKYRSLTYLSPTPQFEINNVNKIAKVTRVIDGDTIEIEGGQRVRYIGINAPEFNDNNNCFAKESFLKNKELVEGKIISLERDISETDKFGRLLRYVYIDKFLINELLVKEGYANVSTYPPDVKYYEKFIKAEKEAQEFNRGLWSNCIELTPIKSG